MDSSVVAQLLEIGSSPTQPRLDNSESKRVLKERIPVCSFRSRVRLGNFRLSAFATRFLSLTKGLLDALAGSAGCYTVGTLPGLVFFAGASVGVGEPGRPHV